PSLATRGGPARCFRWFPQPKMQYARQQRFATGGRSVGRRNPAGDAYDESIGRVRRAAGNLCDHGPQSQIWLSALARSAVTNPALRALASAPRGTTEALVPSCLPSGLFPRLRQPFLIAPTGARSRKLLSARLGSAIIFARSLSVSFSSTRCAYEWRYL